MIHVLYALPDVAILLLVVGLVVGAAAIAPVVGRRIFRLSASETRDEAAFDAYKAILAMVGFVLAFSLVQVDGNLRGVEELVGHEANLLGTVDRVLLRMEVPGAAEARPILAAYGQSLIHDEWPRLTHGQRSEITDARYTELSRTVRHLEPVGLRQETMYAELLRAVDDLSDKREDLIHDSELSLPGFFWVVTGSFLAVALVLGGLTNPTWTRVAGLGGTAAGVALLLAFVIIVDHPFRGETSVSSADIASALALNARRH